MQTQIVVHTVHVHLHHGLHTTLCPSTFFTAEASTCRGTLDRRPSRLRRRRPLPVSLKRSSLLLSGKTSRLILGGLQLCVYLDHAAPLPCARNVSLCSLAETAIDPFFPSTQVSDSKEGCSACKLKLLFTLYTCIYTIVFTRLFALPHFFTAEASTCRGTLDRRPSRLRRRRPLPVSLKRSSGGRVVRFDASAPAPVGENVAPAPRVAKKNRQKQRRDSMPLGMGRRPSVAEKCDTRAARVVAARLGYVWRKS